MANSKYLNYEGLAHFLEKLDERFAPIQAIVFQSTVEDIASLPALNTQKAGYMYNVKTGGITTADFVEGEGHLIADGENVVAVELLTGVYTPKAVAADADPKALGLYEVASTYVQYVPGTPVSDPQSEGFYEFAVGTPSSNPKTEGFFEKVGDNFKATEDETIVVGKDYYNGAVSTDTTVDSGKVYYESETVNVYELTEDRLPESGKTYYEAGKIKKWDSLGGLFDLEGRYLEFGDTFPQGPASRMITGRTFLYMGDNTSVFEYIDTPTGRPDEQGYYEVTFSPVADPTTYFNPKQQGLYEETSSGSGIYALSDDIEVDSGKSYFTAAGTASTDTTVDPSKKYYSKEDQYKKGGIYEYDATAQDWVVQSTGGSDMDPITNAEIDELFI